jgi:hypothetical protein
MWGSLRNKMWTDIHLEELRKHIEHWLRIITLERDSNRGRKVFETKWQPLLRDIESRYIAANGHTAKSVGGNKTFTTLRENWWQWWQTLRWGTATLHVALRPAGWLTGSDESFSWILDLVDRYCSNCFVWRQYDNRKRVTRAGLSEALFSVTEVKRGSICFRHSPVLYS